MEQKEQDLAMRTFAFLRKELSKTYPYMRPAIYFLTPLYDKKEKSMSTDGYYLFYNPDYVMRCFQTDATYRGFQYQYLHILIHCLLGHVFRKNPENQFRYDECADFVTDVILEKLTGKGRKISSNIKYQREYIELRNKAACRTFHAFLRMCQYEKGEYLSKLKNDFYSDDHHYWMTENPAIKEAGLQYMRRDGKERKTAPIDEIWKSLMLQAEDAMKHYSEKMSGLFSRASEYNMLAAKNNVSNYKSLLQRLSSIKEVMQVDDSQFDYIWYQIGMDHYGNIPIIEPSECIEKQVCDSIVIAIDTSGSCSGEIAERFLRETCNLLRDMDIRGSQYQIYILQCDEEIQEEIEIHSAEDIRDFKCKMMYGFGGTDFRPVFQRIEELRKQGKIQKVAALIYLTDGDGEYPAIPPDYETIFILYEELVSEEGYIPAWITKIVLTEDDIKEM